MLNVLELVECSFFIFFFFVFEEESKIDCDDRGGMR